jgi:hypothetical protein
MVIIDGVSLISTIYKLLEHKLSLLSLQALSRCLFSGRYLATGLYMLLYFKD